MPKSVSAERTYGSEAASNATHRIDSIALSSVNSLFEGWYERCYYAHRGNSNSWDTATFGPTSGTKRMWLHNGSGSGMDWPDFVYDPDTNRVITTRRFVEYQHLKDLAEAMYYFIDGHTRLRRPNWEYGSGSGYYGSYVSWSSSLFDGLPLNNAGVMQPAELPTSGWLDPLAFSRLYTPGQWSANAMTFAKTSPGPCPDWSAYSDVDLISANIPYVSVEGANYGEWFNLHGIDTGNAFGMQWHADKSTADVIGRSWAVTNLVYESVTNTVTMSNVNDALLGSRTILDYLETIYQAGYSTNLPFTVEAEIYYNEDDVAWSVELGGSVYPYFRTETPRGSFWVYDASGDPVGGFPSYPQGVWNPFLFGGTVEPGRFPEPYPLDEEDYEIDFSDDVPSYETMMPLWFSATWYGPYSDMTFSLLDHPEITEPYEVGTIIVHYPPKTNVTWHAGVDAITNDTRRLIIDRPAAIGMALAAMDRTYCQVNVPWQDPTLVTNRYAWAERTYEAEFEAERNPFEWDSSLNCMTAWLSGPNGHLPTPVKTVERSSVEGRPSTAVGGSVNAYSSSAALAFNPGAHVKPEGVDQGSVTNDVLWLGYKIPSVFDPGTLAPGDEIDALFEFSYGCFVSKQGVHISIQLFISSGESIGSFALLEFTVPWPEPPYAIPCYVAVDTSTGYSFGETITMPRWRDGFPTYPGEHSRAADATLWTFLSTGFNDVIDPLSWGGLDVYYLPVTQSSYNTNLTFSSTYKMDASSFNSPAECRSKVSSLVDSLLDRCKDHVATVFGADPLQPVDILHRTEAGMRQAGTLASLRLAANARMTLRFEPSTEWWGNSKPEQRVPGMSFCNYMRFIVNEVSVPTYRDSSWSVVQDGGIRSEMRPEYPPSLGYFVLNMDADVTADNPPYETPCPGSAATGKLKPWSRVDWNWNALKRERNNQ